MTTISQCRDSAILDRLTEIIITHDTCILILLACILYSTYLHHFCLYTPTNTVCTYTVWLCINDHTVETDKQVTPVRLQTIWRDCVMKASRHCDLQCMCLSSFKQVLFFKATYITQPMLSGSRSCEHAIVSVMLHRLKHWGITNSW